MPAILYALGMFVADLFKSRSRLEAENPSLLDTVHVVKPETILRWHRAGARAVWRLRSRNRAGRPRIDRELRELIRRMISSVADVLHEHLRSGINPEISATLVFPATPGLARGVQPEFPDVASRHRVRRNIQ